MNRKLFITQLGIEIKFSRNEKLSPFGDPCCFDVFTKECAKTCFYGQEGLCYVVNNFRENLDDRIKLVADNYKQMDKSKSFVNDFVNLLKLNNNPRNFRFFASGDIDKQRHLTKINDIANKCPLTSFWMPTHRIDIVKRWLKTHTKSDNLNIRLSCPKPNYSINYPGSFKRLSKFAKDYKLTLSEVVTSPRYFEKKCGCKAASCYMMNGEIIELCLKCYSNEVDLIQYLMKKNSKKRIQEIEDQLR